MQKTGKAYCEFGFQVYSKPVGEIRIKMEQFALASGRKWKLWSQKPCPGPDPHGSYTRKQVSGQIQGKTWGQDEGKRRGRVGSPCLASVTLPPLQVTAQETALLTTGVWLQQRSHPNLSSQNPHLPLAAECETRWTKQLDGKYILTLFLSGNINLVTDNKTIFNAFVQRTYSSTMIYSALSDHSSCNSRLPFLPL